MDEAELRKERKKWMELLKRGVTIFNEARHAEPAAKIDFRGMDFSRIPDLDLGHVDFMNADLREANFSGVSLWMAQFGGADLRGVKFNGAELQGASFFTATWDDTTDFTGANTEGAQGVSGTRVLLLPSFERHDRRQFPRDVSREVQFSTR